MPVPSKFAAIVIAASIQVSCAAHCFGADDKTPSKSDPSDPPAKAEEKSPVGENKKTGKDEPSLLDKLSKELFKDVDDGASRSAEKEHKLERAAKGMRNAGSKLDESQTGKETRKIQEQVIRDLDELINQLQNPPPQGDGGGGGGGGGGGKAGAAGASGQARAQKMGSGQGKLQAGQASSGQGQAGQSQSGQGASSNKSGSQDKKIAEGSDGRTESERKAADETARKKKLEMDIWGHLPPHLRAEMINTYGERMLPKYQQLVKQFYEALSDQKNSPPRR